MLTFLQTVTFTYFVYINQYVLERNERYLKEIALKRVVPSLALKHAYICTRIFAFFCNRCTISQLYTVVLYNFVGTTSYISHYIADNRNAVQRVVLNMDTDVTLCFPMSTPMK